MFEGKRIVITGGSSGVGKTLAQRLLSRGAVLVLLARDAGKLDTARRELGGTDRVDIESCDVSDADAVTASFAAIRERGGPIDMLINSAGVLKEGPFDELPLSSYRQVMDINLFGTLHCVRAAVPLLEERGGGNIVNIASVAGLMGVYGYAPYCASKHALVGLSETLRIELKPRGIHVHVVCPPEFESPMVDELEQYRSPENRAMVRALGVMKVEDVAAETLRGLERGRYQIIPGRNARVLTTFARLFPRFTRSGVDRSLARARNRAKTS